MVFSNCSNTTQEVKVLQETKPSSVNEFELLISLVEKAGLTMNNPEAPFIVDALDVFYNKSNYLVIDIRDSLLYIDGHIDGAKNIKFSKLLNFMETSAKPEGYEKVVLACNNGQQSAFATTALRMAGYGNTYSLRWGMSSWSKNLAATQWGQKISDKYTSALVTEQYSKARSENKPTINTGKKESIQILKKRVSTVIEKGFKPYKITIDSVMQNPDHYYIINYWPDTIYKQGHLPGAHQYLPRNSLTSTTDLYTLPTNKEIVVYCYTGQFSSAIAAYLNILGYKCKSIVFGANGFMYNRLGSYGEQWPRFNLAEDALNLPLIKGNKPSLADSLINSEKNTDNSVVSTPVLPPPPSGNKKKRVQGGC